jgi:NTE family protein
MAQSAAVVLGAGGPAGIAWEIGVIAGLAEQGVDLRHAGLYIGTSAGSVVAAQITSGLAVEKLYQQQVDSQQQVRELLPRIDFNSLRDNLARAREGEGGVREALQRIGALALDAETISEVERRNVIAGRLPSHAWPAAALRVVAVDVESGERRVFDRSSGVDLIDAVAASCAVPGVWPPVSIGRCRYMDGGVYATENADLAIGCDRVLVLALTPRVPPVAVTSLDSAVRALRKHGAKVEVVHPDAATEAAFASIGGNLLDPSVRAVAARAGREQGRALPIVPAWT